MAMEGPKKKHHLVKQLMDNVAISAYGRDMEDLSTYGYRMISDDTYIYIYVIMCVCVHTSISATTLQESSCRSWGSIGTSACHGCLVQRRYTRRKALIHIGAGLEELQDQAIVQILGTRCQMVPGGARWCHVPATCK